MLGKFLERRSLKMEVRYHTMRINHISDEIVKWGKAHLDNPDDREIREVYRRLILDKVREEDKLIANVARLETITSRWWVF